MTKLKTCCYPDCEKTAVGTMWILEEYYVPHFACEDHEGHIYQITPLEVEELEID